MTEPINEGLETTLIEVLHLQKFTKRGDLRLTLQSRGYYMTDRRLRKTVEHLITDSGYAIASSERGYSLITSSEQLQEAIDYLNSKAMALHERAKCLRLNHISGKLQEQLNLFA